MKRFSIALCAVLLLAAHPQRGALAQGPCPGPDHGMLRTFPPREQGVSDLSDQQKEQMKKLRLALAEKTLPLRNQLGEKEAHMRTLICARVIDAAAIEKTAEEIGELRNRIYKAEVMNEANVRGLLTEDQKVSLDAPPGPMPSHGGEAPPPRR